MSEMISAMCSVARGVWCGGRQLSVFRSSKNAASNFAGKFAQRGFRFADALDDFVLHVRDVHDVMDVVAFEFEIAADQIAENKRAPVSDVGEVIDRRPAAIHADLLSRRVERNEFLDRPRQSVEKF